MNIIKTKIKPDFKKIIFIVAVAAFSVYGIQQATIATVNKVNSELDEFAVNRVINRHLVEKDGKTIIKEVEVPVVKAADVDEMANKLENKTEELLKK